MCIWSSHTMACQRGITERRGVCERQDRTDRHRHAQLHVLSQGFGVLLARESPHGGRELRLHEHINKVLSQREEYVLHSLLFDVEEQCHIEIDRQALLCRHCSRSTNPRVRQADGARHRRKLKRTHTTAGAWGQRPGGGRACAGAHRGSAARGAASWSRTSE